MVHLLVAIALSLCSLTAAQAANEREVTQALANRLSSAAAEAQAEWTISDLRLVASMGVASERRTLDMEIAGKQLAAELGAAAADLASAQVNPAQARAIYVQAVGQALGRYQQAVGSAHNRWANECGAAYNRAQQECGASQNNLQQEVSSALQEFASALQDPGLAEAPPVIDRAIPHMAPAETLTSEQVGALEKALADARAAYRADTALALANCDEELRDAVATAKAADRAAAIRKAVSKLSLICLDRHDQYSADVRAILRRALLATGP